MALDYDYSYSKSRSSYIQFRANQGRLDSLYECSSILDTYSIYSTFRAVIACPLSIAHD